MNRPSTKSSLVRDIAFILLIGASGYAVGKGAEDLYKQQNIDSAIPKLFIGSLLIYKLGKSLRNKIGTDEFLYGFREGSEGVKKLMEQPHILNLAAKYPFVCAFRTGKDVCIYFDDEPPHSETNYFEVDMGSSPSYYQGIAGKDIVYLSTKDPIWPALLSEHFEQPYEKFHRIFPAKQDILLQDQKPRTPEEDLDQEV
jgi:hypothetical protein